MKTKLPDTVTTEEQAKDFLRRVNENDLNDPDSLEVTDDELRKFFSLLRHIEHNFFDPYYFLEGLEKKLEIIGNRQF